MVVVEEQEVAEVVEEEPKSSFFVSFLYAVVFVALLIVVDRIWISITNYTPVVDWGGWRRRVVAVVVAVVSLHLMLLL